MKLSLHHSRGDRAVDVDLFEGINPLNPNGDGYPVDMDALMATALIRLVYQPNESTYFQCDRGAWQLMDIKRIAQVESERSFRGIPVRLI